MYKKDPVNGLRGIAIISVILYHLKLPLFSGGFVGVDIFFVISGYVLTLNIRLLKLSSDNYLKEYFERRFRRIIPPLIVVVVFSFMVGAYILDSSSFASLARSQVAAILFISNILFWKEAGYFNAASQFKPLLNTWSLSVEVQLYFILPFALIVIEKYIKKYCLRTLVVIAIVSFSLSIILTHYRPAASFYLLPTRAWEFMCGVILAWFMAEDKFSKINADFIGLVGLLLILYSIFNYNENTNVPGISAIPPVMGGLAILFSCKNQKSLAAKILSFKILFFVGAISYSLYLWHWPIIAYWNYLSFNSNGLFDISLILLLSLLAASLSWRYIEQPFRLRSGSLPIFQNILIFSVALVALIICISIFVHLKNGMPQRDVEANNIFSENVYDWARRELPGVAFQEASPLNNPAIIGDKNFKPTFIVWGDSHAVSISAGVDDVAKKYGLSGYLVTKGSSIPLTGIDSLPQSGLAKWNEEVKRFILDNPSIRKVYLIAAWSNYVNGRSGQYVLVDDFDKKINNREIILKIAFTNTIDWIRKSGREVIYVSNVPILRYDPVRLVYLQRRFNDFKSYENLMVHISPSKDEYLIDNKFLDEHAHYLGIKTLSPENILFARSDHSIYFYEGKLLYTDNNHISLSGSYLISPIFEESLSSGLKILK